MVHRESAACPSRTATPSPPCSVPGTLRHSLESSLSLSALWPPVWFSQREALMQIKVQEEAGRCDFRSCFATESQVGRGCIPFLSLHGCQQVQP